MKFNINDKVEHEIYGKGTIVEISTESYLVKFDVPNAHLHDGNGYSKKRYENNSCYYFDGSQLKLLKSIRLPERYIINKNATILFWGNGEKTVVKRCEDDEFNPRLAFLTAFFQHYCGMSKNKANKYLASLEVEKTKPTNIIVKVIDRGKVYSTYNDFLKQYFSEYINNFKMGDVPKKGKKYMLIGKRKHTSYGNIVALIQDTVTNQVFIIDENGIREDK